MIIDIIKNDGDNNYLIKHHKKASMENNGWLEYEVVLDNEIKDIINRKELKNQPIIETISLC